MAFIKACNYLHDLYDKNTGYFKFSYTSKPTLLATDFSLMTLFLINETINNKKNVINTILKNKTASNYFGDLNYDDRVERYHKPDYVINQFTFFTLIALDQLGYHYNKLPFFDNFLNLDSFKEWFTDLKWDQFWYESNKIMFWLFFYSYIIKYGNEQDSQRASECIVHAFEVLNKKQDKNTGYWGTDLNNNNIIDGCFGSAHIYLFYDYFKKEIQYPEKIIDNTLSLHAKNGLILSKEGGACEDYDAVEIYLRLIKQSNYRKEEIIYILKKMKKTIINNQHTSGGFSYRFAPKKYGLFKENKIANYRYSSWELMETNSYEPDTWGTFFRVLTIAAIDSILDNKNSCYRSYSLPGWGFIY